MKLLLKVAFYKGNKRLFNRLTAWWLAGEYSHCELILGTDENGLSICASSSMMDGGVRVKHMRLDPAHWDIVEVRADPKLAWAWLEEHEGDGYDYFGLLGFILRPLKQDQTRWFCNEAVGGMLGVEDPWRFDTCSFYPLCRVMK